VADAPGQTRWASVEANMSAIPKHAPAAPVTLSSEHTVTIVTDRFALEVPPSAHTMDGFREWATRDDFPRRVRVTYLQGGVTLDMSNEEINAHVLAKTEITSALAALVKREKLGRFFADGMPLTNAAAGLSSNPDAVFVSRASFEAAAVKPVPKKGAEHLFRELEGTPDWVLEIVSEGSVQKDSVRLREAYHRAGVPEYWLVDARGEAVSFQVLLRRKSGYQAAAAKDGWHRSKVFGRSFRLERALDDFGLWEYTLDSRDE
jgi:Uma2 family endonuclease